MHEMHTHSEMEKWWYVTTKWKSSSVCLKSDCLLGCAFLHDDTILYLISAANPVIAGTGVYRIKMGPRKYSVRRCALSGIVLAFSAKDSCEGINQEESYQRVICFSLEWTASRLKSLKVYPGFLPIGHPPLDFFSARHLTDVCTGSFSTPLSHKLPFFIVDT